MTDLEQLHRMSRNLIFALDVKLPDDACERICATFRELVEYRERHYDATLLCDSLESLGDTVQRDTARRIRAVLEGT